MKKFALLLVVFLGLGMILLSCGKKSSNTTGTQTVSGLTERVYASQSASTATSFAGLVLVNGSTDTLARGGVSAGNSPGLMILDPARATLLAFDSATNRVEVVNTVKESATGSIQLAGPTTSIAEPNSGVAFAAVPSAPLTGAAPGAVVEMNLVSGATTATIGVPSAQTVVSNPSGTQLLAFSNDPTLVNSVTVVSPSLLNSGSPVSTTVPGFDHPVNALYTSDGGTAYVLNCGPQCGGAQASVQVVDTLTTPPTLTGSPIPVDAATIAYLNGSTLYVAGFPPTNNACTGQTTAATACGRLDVVDLGSMTVTASVVITDGYHNRIDLGLGGQLFIGSYGCTTVGNVNNPQGEVRGCLSIYNTGDGSVVIPPDNGDVTGLQSFSSRYVEYVAEGGNLRVYNTQTDTLLINDYITTGTIVVAGSIIDVKAVDFF